MNTYDCWLCHHSEDRKSELKHHMVAVHGRMKVLCAWCVGKEFYLWKAVDLMKHVKKSHWDIWKRSSSQTFGEPNCFWLAKAPQDYMKLVTPTKRDSREATFVRKSVEEWWATMEGKTPSRPLSAWKEGWRRIPLVSPSPSPILDYSGEKRRRNIHDVVITSEKVTALIYEDQEAGTVWMKVDVKPTIMNEARQKESLLRRLHQVKPFKGAVPKSFCQPLTGKELEECKKKVASTLIISDDLIYSISLKTVVLFSEPAKKKQKTTHPEATLVALTKGKKPEPLLPLDVLLPKTTSQLREPNQPDRQAPNPEEHHEQMKTIGAASETIAESSPSTSVNARTETSTYSSPAKLPGLPSQVISVPSPETSVAVANHQREPVLKSANQFLTTSTDQTATSCIVPLMSSQSDDQESVDPVNGTESDPFFPSLTLDTQLPVTIIDSNQQQPSPSRDMNHPTVPFHQSPSAVPHLARHFSAARASDLVRSPSSFHVMNAAGDNWAYDPESTRVPSYTPTQTQPSATHVSIIPDQGTMPDDLRSRAEVLLTKGCMPLLPPARRNWTSEEEIKLPLSALFAWWPPQRWMALSSDAKLMVWESVAMSLALKDGFVDMERGEILDHYNFLALPGSAPPQLKSDYQTSRYFLFKVVRDLFLGKTQASESNKQLINMLDAAKAAAFQSSSTIQILEQIEKKGISPRLSP